MAVQTRKEKEDPDDKQGVNSRVKAMDSALKENLPNFGATHGHECQEHV